MGDGGAEKRHDSVPGELVDGSLEAVNLARQDFETPVHDAVHVFRIEGLRYPGVVAYIGEKDGHLLALPLEGAAGFQYFIDEVFRGVGGKSGGLFFCPGFRERRSGRFSCGVSGRIAAPIAKTHFGPKGVPAGAASPFDLRAAFLTKLRMVPVLVTAGRAFHDSSPLLSKIVSNDCFVRLELCGNAFLFSNSENFHLREQLSGLVFEPTMEAEPPARSLPGGGRIAGGGG